MSPKLALFGGPKTRTEPFPHHPILGPEEENAALEVVRGGRLSTFIAQPGEHFLGGPRIRAFEEEFAGYIGTKYAVAMNSATAALHAAVAACGVQPGEEVVTTPYSFTSTATCALMHNAVPVFADVEEETACLDPRSVEERLSPLSRAIIAVHLFGHPADMDAFLALAKKKGLKLIEDCAQAPGGEYKGKKLGTMGDCGVFSFQESKNMMTGEGGMLVTDDESIAETARLVRNHGEAIAETLSARTYRAEVLGWGYRMTEFEAAIGRVQLKRLDELNAARRRLAAHLTKRLSRIPGILPPAERPGCKHVYYLYPFRYDEGRIGVPRDRFAEALRAEGVPVGTGYVKPLYASPLYQERRAFAFKHYKGSGTETYRDGSCPVVEKLNRKALVTFAVVRPPALERDMDDIADAVEKVLAQKDTLAHEATPA